LSASALLRDPEELSDQGWAHVRTANPGQQKPFHQIASRLMVCAIAVTLLSTPLSLFVLPA
jgi:hypothetical protein